MYNLFTANTNNTVAHKPDLLDILLKLSPIEREAVLKEVENANKPVDGKDVVYYNKDKNDTTVRLFCA